jgi:hypothetical protein
VTSVGRTIAVALLGLVSSCVGHDSTASQKTTLYVYARFTNPAVTVTVNGQTLGQLTREYTGGNDCASLAAVVTPGTMFHTTVELGQTYDIEWNYGGGRSDRDELAATSDVIASPCLFEEIAAPIGAIPD